MARTGRPRLDDPRHGVSRYVRFRISPDTLELLKRRAELESNSIGAVARRLVWEGLARAERVTR